MLKMFSCSMLVLGIFACLEHLSRYARRVELLSRFAYDFARFACRRFLLSFFGMLRFVDCVCFWSFVRFSFVLTIFDCQRALCSFSSQLDIEDGAIALYRTYLKHVDIHAPLIMQGGRLRGYYSRGRDFASVPQHTPPPPPPNSPSRPK